MKTDKIQNKALKAVYEDAKDGRLKKESIDTLQEVSKSLTDAENAKYDGLQPGRIAKLKRQAAKTQK